VRAFSILYKQKLTVHIAFSFQQMAGRAMVRETSWWEKNDGFHNGGGRLRSAVNWFFAAFECMGRRNFSDFHENFSFSLDLRWKIHEFHWRLTRIWLCNGCLTVEHRKNFNLKFGWTILIIQIHVNFTRLGNHINRTHFVRWKSLVFQRFFHFSQHFFCFSVEMLQETPPLLTPIFFFHKISTHSWHFLITFHQFSGEFSKFFQFLQHSTGFREFSLDFFGIFAAQFLCSMVTSCHIENYIHTFVLLIVFRLYITDDGWWCYDGGVWWMTLLVWVFSWNGIYFEKENKSELVVLGIRTRKSISLSKGIVNLQI
jgi:hypothetical protein